MRVFSTRPEGRRQTGGTEGGKEGGKEKMRDRVLVFENCVLFYRDAYLSSPRKGWTEKSSRENHEAHRGHDDPNFT